MDVNVWKAAATAKIKTAGNRRSLKNCPIKQKESWSHENKNSSAETKAEKTENVKECVEIFASRTSIMGLMQIASRKGLLWKLFWTVITLLSTFMAFYQSWSILHDYVGGKTVQSAVYSTTFEFPSVTLCSNIHLSQSEREKYDVVTTTDVTRGNLSQLVPFLNSLLQLENEINHSPFGPQMSLNKCIFNRKNCNKKDENDVYYFDTALYGNCLTYNPATKIQKLSLPNYYLTLEIPMQPISRRQEYNDNYVSIWIHSPGSAPVLDRQEDIRVYPGDAMDIKLQIKKIVSLPKRGNECVNSRTFEKRFTSVFYTNVSTYLYSARACMYSMMFEEMLKKWSCLDPTIPRNEKWLRYWQSGYYNICFPGSNTQFPEYEAEDSTGIFQDNCSITCSEWLLDYVIISRSAWFETMVDRSLKNKPENFSILNFDSAKASVKFRLGSPMIEEVHEVYRYTFGDCAGIIGGNIGVWIGLCTISLAEILELFISVIIIKFKNFFYEEETPANTYQINPRKKERNQQTHFY